MKLGIGASNSLQTYIVDETLPGLGNSCDVINSSNTWNMQAVSVEVGVDVSIVV